MHFPALAKQGSAKQGSESEVSPRFSDPNQQVARLFGWKRVRAWRSLRGV